MAVLDVPKSDWSSRIASRNGAPLRRPDASADDSVADAGPWEPAVREIVSYQHVSDNWDGYGAEAPSREVLQSAIGLAYTYLENGVDPPHRVAPGVAGSVIFEWQFSDGAYATVEVDGWLHAEVMWIAPGKPPLQWTLPTE